ncbi:glycerol kinase-like [Cimex lectularius]|uniref:Probable glycerol kinase n=1 Tax=Cimex lectularius TaxID=79782 RepID=A0A8I6SEV9_CIMLE|nr:glycerol kinase-like [Cimex lectularius]
MSLNDLSFAPLVGAIDAGTSSVRFLVFSSETFQPIASHQIPLTNICLKEGWVEQDPLIILREVKNCLEKIVERLKAEGIDPSHIASIGISNQRETTIAWDKETGQPLFNALVWCDTRTTIILDHLLENVPSKNKDHFKEICGLPMSPYFSALKMRWLLDNVQPVREALERNTLLFGTVDSWLIWNLTGGTNGGVHITDVTNASRTMLMNLSTLQWDPKMCKFLDIQMHLLPEIRSSSEIYGKLVYGMLKGTPIAGCLGDQQAALLGQKCITKGQAKSTYGTGCFLLCNTGTEIAHSTHGLLTTVSYQLGKTAPVCYALEGSVAVAGSAFAWLKDNLTLIEEMKDVEKLAKEVQHSDDVYFVPAFSGLFAPYWQPNARGVICGITEDTTRAHILMAALEAICFQTRDILEAMYKDCNISFSKLKVDGGMIKNNLLMQLQADLCGVPVVRPHMAEISALGAALAAGLALNVIDFKNITQSPSDTFYPQITDEERDYRYSKWKLAIEKSLGWDI